MFYVCQIGFNRELGEINEFEKMSDAIDRVQEIVSENGVELTPEVLEEIEDDCGYIADEWSVQIGKVG